MRPLVCLLLLTLMAPASACLWDYDTLAMERQQFPGALELIVGRFLRHSDPFYEWRIEDRTERIAAGNLPPEKLAAAYDDLAVAQDKLDRHDAAIATIREKAEAVPNVGRYETAANLGTFLIHAGRYEEGLTELRKALAINPNAHFGREKYQVLLVEYVLEKRGDAETAPLPLNAKISAYGDNLLPFTRWLLEKQGFSGTQGLTDRAVQAEIALATKGVLGMMRFGDHQSPVLLELLAQLLVNGMSEKDLHFGQQLAARAYLRAAEVVSSEDVKSQYRENARQALDIQKNVASRDHLSLNEVERQLNRELHETETWFNAVKKDEAKWVAKSSDPDAAFWNKYGIQEVRVGYERLPEARYSKTGLPGFAKWFIGLGVAAMLGLVAGLIFWRRQKPNGYESWGSE